MCLDQCLGPDGDQPAQKLSEGTGRCLVQATALPLPGAGWGARPSRPATWRAESLCLLTACPQGSAGYRNQGWGLPSGSEPGRAWLSAFSACSLFKGPLVQRDDDICLFLPSDEKFHLSVDYSIEEKMKHRTKRIHVQK